MGEGAVLFQELYLDPQIHASWQRQQDGHFGIENSGTWGHRTHDLGLGHGTGSFGLYQHWYFSPSSAGLDGGASKDARPHLAWGTFGFSENSRCNNPRRRPWGWPCLGSSGPSHKCQNIPTTTLTPTPPKLHSSVKIHLKSVDVSPLCLSPRKLKPWSQLPGFAEGPPQAVPTGASL